MAEAVYPGMVARGHGRIINIASQLAFKGGPNIVPYCTAKAGIVGFTRSLAWEAAPKGIQVNAIAPGPIETDLTRARGPEWKKAMEDTILAGRLGQPEEIAATALLLAGPGGGLLRRRDAVAQRRRRDALNLPAPGRQPAGPVHACRGI